MNPAKPPVVVLGASANPERYSNKAVRLLVEHGYPVHPIHPALDEVEGLAVTHSIGELPQDGSVDTVTVYVSPPVSSTLAKQLVALNPRRVIFNPGAENPILEAELGSAGIEVENACTLVLVNTGQY
ncbi:MAG: CoA-binding protein [Verrucomicrobiales bacterium]|nr:CoA-binding protein [Verrucomicrobiales bacterium]